MPLRRNEFEEVRLRLGGRLCHCLAVATLRSKLQSRARENSTIAIIFGTGSVPNVCPCTLPSSTFECVRLFGFWPGEEKPDGGPKNSSVFGAA